MFGRIKQAIDDALRALEEKSGRGPEEDVEELLRAMREELVAARARVPELEAGLGKLEKSLDAERARLEACGRRARQAREIGDEETVDVAVRFAATHRSRIEVLEQKRDAAIAEIRLQRATVADMTDQLKSAIARRDALSVQARRARATRSLRAEGADAVDEFERLEREIEGEEALAEASSDVERELDGPGPGWVEPDDGPALDRDEMADLQLEELKRRMAAEGEDGEDGA
ncbi:MAG: PspA/IM30 family protein [Gemmatimonadota bacterium]